MGNSTSVEARLKKSVVERHVANFIKNDQYVDYLIANAPYMNITQLTKLFECFDYVIKAIAKELNIPLNETFSEIPLNCIITRLRVLPPEAIVRTIKTGTLVILPKDDKYLRTIHHFSAGYQHKRVAVESQSTELPPHFTPRLWN